MELKVSWKEGMQFEATTVSGHSVVVDGDKEAGASPMEALLLALGGCMGIDIVDIMQKGRQELVGCTLTLSGERREDPPRRFTSIDLLVTLTGHSLSRSKAERAVELSRSKYCSVSNSLAPDIDFNVELELLDVDGNSGRGLN